jgi:DNA repair protein RadC
LPDHSDARPRERILRQGVKAASVSELVAAILGPKAEEMEVADRLLRRFDGNLVRMADETPQSLARCIGLGPSQGAQLAAVFELGRRWAHFLPSTNPAIQTASDVANFLMPHMRGESQEVLYVLCLNAKNVITNHRPLFVGTLNASLIHPREVFRFAVENAAASIVLAHNHPSGDPTPSDEDVTITRRLVEAGRALEIPILDHVILGENVFHSLKESGAIP